jgi:hypothetical protein
MTVTRDVFAARAARSRRLNAFKRRPEVAVEQVNIRRQREGRGVVAEPSLYLNRVAALGERERGACMAEGVEAHPIQVRLRASAHTGIKMLIVALHRVSIVPDGLLKIRWPVWRVRGQ